MVGGLRCHWSRMEWMTKEVEETSLLSPSRRGTGNEVVDLGDDEGWME